MYIFKILLFYHCIRFISRQFIFFSREKKEKKRKFHLFIDTHRYFVIMTLSIIIYININKYQIFSCLIKIFSCPKHYHDASTMMTHQLGNFRRQCHLLFDLAYHSTANFFFFFFTRRTSLVSR